MGCGPACTDGRGWGGCFSVLSRGGCSRTSCVRCWPTCRGRTPGGWPNTPGTPPHDPSQRSTAALDQSNTPFVREGLEHAISPNLTSQDHQANGAAPPSRARPYPNPTPPWREECNPAPRAARDGIAKHLIEEVGELRRVAITDQVPDGGARVGVTNLKSHNTRRNR